MWAGYHDVQLSNFAYQDFDDDFDQRYMELDGMDVGDDEELCACGRPTCGEGCEECGEPLCPMCFECGAGFCDECSTENFWLPGDDHSVD